MRTLIAGLLVLLTTPLADAQPPKPAKDAFGDPLPEGAVLRLGTARLRGHATGFGILADGTVVTVAANDEVRTWGPKDDEPSIGLPLLAPGSRAHFAKPQVSPDGRLIATYSNDKVVVWERPVDKLTEVAAFEIDKPRYVQFSPDGSKLAVTYRTERAERMNLCDIKTAKVTDLAGEPQYFECFGFSGDGKRLVGTDGYKVFAWDTATGKQLADYQTPRLQGARLRISRFAVDRAGDVLAVVPTWEPYSVQFLDVLTGKPREGLTGPVASGWVTFAPDGKTILVGDYTSIRWWDPVAGKLLRRFEGVAFTGYGGPVPMAAVTRDDKTLVASNGSMLLRWDWATAKPLFAAHTVGHASYVNGLGVSPDGSRIATRGMDNRLVMWDAKTGRQLWAAPATWSNDTQVVFSADGKAVFAAGPKWGGLTKRDAATGKELELFTVDPSEPKQTATRPIRLSPDGKTLFAITGPRTAGTPHVLTAWDAATGERKSSFQLRHVLHFGCELSPDGRTVADAFAGIFPVDDPKKNLMTDAKVRGFGRPGLFEAGGRWFVTTGYAPEDEEREKNLVAVTDPSNWTTVNVIPVPKESRVALSPDGKTLAVAGGEALVFIDRAGGKEFACYRLPFPDRDADGMSSTQAVRFSPDGSRVVTGHTDTTAIVWRVPRGGE